MTNRQEQEVTTADLLALFKRLTPAQRRQLLDQWTCTVAGRTSAGGSVA